MARLPSTPDCSIKGCSRAAHKGFLCRKHYEMLPPSERGYAVAADAMMAAWKASDWWHKRQLRVVRELLKA